MSSLSKLTYHFFNNILEDFSDGLILSNRRYFYYLEGSLASIMMLERSVSWCELYLFFNAVQVTATLDINPKINSKNLCFTKKGRPDAAIIVSPKPVFLGTCYLENELENEIVPIYLTDLDMDKFMIRRLESF